MKVPKSIWKELKKKKNVVGYSGTLKPRIREGREVPNTKVLRVYVATKQPLSALSEKDLIPRALSLGDEIIETDVVEIGEIKALGSGRETRKKFRPVLAGISACHEKCTACTLGGFAKNKKEGEEEFIGIIANNHCCALENKGKKGDLYIQPSPHDGGNAGYSIGKLWRFVPIKFNDYTCPYRNFFYKFIKPFVETENRVDVGLVRLDERVPYKLDVLNIGRWREKRRPREGELAQKMGRTTGHTKGGKVIDLDWNGVVSYSRGKAFFTDCCLIEKRNFSAGGDSSSPIGGMDLSFWGLLFAGSSSHTIMCYYDNIEEELEVEILI